LNPLIGTAAQRRLALWLVALALLAACLPARTSGAPFPRSVADAAGRSVTLNAPAQQVLVVGDSALVDAALPCALRRPLDPAAPQQADWQGADLLVIPTWAAAAYPALVAQAQTAGVPLFQIKAAMSLEDWRVTVDALGTLTGQEARAGRALARLDVALRWAVQRVEGAPPVRALVLTPEGYTFGGDTLLDELIAAAGGVNAAGGFDDFRQIDDAAIRALAPDVVLLTPGWLPDQVAALRANPTFAAVPAWRAGRVWVLPFSPAQPRDPGAAVLWLAARLHPARLTSPPGPRSN